MNEGYDRYGHISAVEEQVVSNEKEKKTSSRRTSALKGFLKSLPFGDHWITEQFSTNQESVLSEAEVSVDSRLVTLFESPSPLTWCRIVVLFYRIRKTWCMVQRKTGCMFNYPYIKMDCFVQLVINPLGRPLYGDLG